MNSIKPQLITFGFAFVPYFLVSWGYAALTDGNSRTLWATFGILIGVRLFFGLIEMLGSVLAWRLYGKKFMVEKALQMFRSNKFPMREYSHDDLGNYLARIEDDEEVSPAVKRAAKDLEVVLGMFENQGILIGARVYSATEAALDIYSPKTAAKELSWGQ